MIRNTKKLAQREFYLSNGDLIAFTGGFPLGEFKKTNYLLWKSEYFK